MSNTKKLTRRRFLRYGTLATTATLALPTIAPLFGTRWPRRLRRREAQWPKEPPVYPMLANLLRSPPGSFGTRRPDQPRAGRPRASGPASPEQGDRCEAERRDPDGELPSQEHLSEARRRRPPPGGAARAPNGDSRAPLNRPVSRSIPCRLPGLPHFCLVYPSSMGIRESPRGSTLKP